MSTYHRAGASRNTRKPSKPINFQQEPELTRAGRVIKTRRPAWSASLCNAVAGLAGFSQEAHHVG